MSPDERTPFGIGRIGLLAAVLAASAGSVGLRRRLQPSVSQVAHKAKNKRKKKLSTASKRRNRG